MKLTIGNTLHGFTITNIRDIPNKNATLIEMCYTKTNTELCWYKSSENNKLFCIGFKTLPKDDTGVFHILEHSVLAGSEKYPTKEPFVDLLKSSMNTFLNAITFSDKTIYPVSSRNTQDFLNLTSVYLDAVFAPLMRTHENIFLQEGWHYELKEDKLIYNGVVFNEMKGATSSVNTLISDHMQSMLFKDNCYGFNSGGDPKAIPDLTYEAYVNTYNDFYHPSNARIFLDGDIPLEDVLTLIDSYLCKYEVGNKHEIIPQYPCENEKNMYYESSDKDTKNKAYLSIGKIISTYKDTIKVLAMSVLSDVLAGTNESILTRTILESNLGQDVRMFINDGIYQPYFTLRIDNIENENSEAILSLIKTCIQDVITKGIDKKELIAAINSLSYQLKDVHEPQGLYRAISAYDAWLYNDDPMLFLNMDAMCDTLKELVDSDYYEKLLKEMLLEDTGMCILHTLPSLTYGEEIRKAEYDRLEKEQNSFNEEEMKAIIEKAEALAKWQKSTDSKEALDTIPVLDLSQVDIKPIFTSTTKETIENVPVLRHKIDTNSIVHMSLYFDLSDFTKEELTQISFMTNLFSELNTAHYNTTALQNEIKTYIGNLSFNVEAYAPKDSIQTCTPYLSVNCSVLEENYEIAEKLIHEILMNTIFETKNRIKEVALQSQMMAKQYLITGGRNIASFVSQSHYSSLGAVNEAMHGYTYLKWVNDFATQYEAMYDSFMTLVNKVIDCLGKKRMILSISENKEREVSSILHLFKEGKDIKNTCTYTSSLPKKTGIKIPAQVSYAVSAHHLLAQNTKYEGSLKLLAHIATFAYLWDEVRVQGGAYGTGMSVGRSGSFNLYSYRDPSPERSLEVYRNLSTFIEKLAKNESLTKYIIAAIASLEPLQTPAQQAKSADIAWFTNFTYEDALKEREEILCANKDSLTKWSDVLNTQAKEGSVCVVGYMEALNKCAKENLTILEI